MVRGTFLWNTSVNRNAVLQILVFVFYRYLPSPMAFHKKVPRTNLIYIEKKQVIRFNRNAEHADLADFLIL